MDEESLRDLIQGLSSSGCVSTYVYCPSGQSRQVTQIEFKAIADYVRRLESGLVHFAIKCASLEK